MDWGQKLDVQTVLDGLGQGVLLFDEAGRLALDNVAARTILGSSLTLIRDEGWMAAAVLFNSGQPDPDSTIDAVRRRALDLGQPVRFHIYRFGEYIPCWVAVLNGQDGDTFTMITLDSADWTVVKDLIGKFRTEVAEAIDSTQGHLNLITQSIKRMNPDDTVEHLSKRIAGFNRLIATHMFRTQTLMHMLGRLEILRTGQLTQHLEQRRQQINLSDFIEDFLEELDETALVDPETEDQDIRGRIQTNVPEGLKLEVSPQHLTTILRDILRNAIMYSMKATPVKINVTDKQDGVQIDVVDEGYGVRNQDKIFQMFQRARQPQIIAEFGHGLSLYLCKHEIEAMNGRLWFESEEGVGSTFSFQLPHTAPKKDSDSSSAKN